jgi:phage gpG-like protein
VNISDLAQRLARLDLQAVQRAALQVQAETLAGAVREALNTPPGGDHRFPWRRTGTLHDSISVSADDDAAIVGSTSDEALYQELGTATIPPRPFLATIAAEHSERAAEAIGAAVAAALRGL